MSDKTLAIILIIWLGSNIFLPLLIRSLDRLYKKEIDNFVSLLFFGASYTFTLATQIIFIIFFLPALVVVLPLLKIKNKKIQNTLIKTGLSILPKILFDKKFTIISLMRHMFIVKEIKSPNKKVKRDK